MHERRQIKAGGRGFLALTFPIPHCLRCGMTFTCSYKLALTELNVSDSFSEVHQALKSKPAFPLVSKPTKLPVLP